ncbi:MAG TPA: zinc ribbon domain-containing protein [Polyangia bacterium]|nr:zinc ribbon domain-containing protein [Polyangia bacterium]
MPIYEYACGACGHRFEEWQKMSDPPVRTCPKCKAKKVEKLISQTSFTLKGGGWYSDLYAGPKPGASSSSSSDSSSSSSSESTSSKESSSMKSDKSDKSETKPATPAKKSKKTGAA